MNPWKVVLTGAQAITSWCEAAPDMFARVAYPFVTMVLSPLLLMQARYRPGLGYLPLARTCHPATDSKALALAQAAVIYADD